MFCCHEVGGGGGSRTSMSLRLLISRLLCCFSCLQWKKVERFRQRHGSHRRPAAARLRTNQTQAKTLKRNDGCEAHVWGAAALEAHSKQVRVFSKIKCHLLEVFKRQVLHFLAELQTKSVTFDPKIILFSLYSEYELYAQNAPRLVSCFWSIFSAVLQHHTQVCERYNDECIFIKHKKKTPFRTLYCTTSHFQHFHVYFRKRK